MIKKGFTAVEVMSTLIIAALFLFTGYHLFGAIYNHQLASRMRAEASNIAYAHLRQKSNTLSVSVCASGAVQTVETPGENDDLPGIQILSIVSAPYGCSEKLRRIEIQVSYKIGSTTQTERQAIYVDKTTR